MLVLQAFFIFLSTIVAVIIVRAFCYKRPRAQLSNRAGLHIDRDAAVDHLSQALQFETTTDNANAFIDLQRHLFQTYPKIFSQLEIQKFGKFAVLLKWQGLDTSLKPFMFIAHQDVVPVPQDECESWTFPPFSGKIEKEYIYGRGALDMKSTLMAILEAVNHLLEESYQPQRTLYIYMGDDEEIGGPTAKIAADWMASQNIHLSYILDEGGAILEKMTPKIQQSVALIGIAQKGVMNLKLTVRGNSGHAAQPPQETPIDILGAAVVKIMQNPMPAHPNSLVFPLFRKIAPHVSFLQRIIFANLWLFKLFVTRQLQAIPFMNAMLRTTAAPTLFESGVKQNVIPESATANINYRLYPGDTASTVLTHMEAAIKDPRVTMEVTDSCNATFLSKSDSLGFEIVSEAIQALNKEDVIIAPVLTIGGTDGRHFRGLCDDLYQFLFIRGTMDDFKRYHGMNERISIKNYLNQIEFYHYLIKNETRKK